MLLLSGREPALDTDLMQSNLPDNVASDPNYWYTVPGLLKLVESSGYRSTEQVAFSLAVPLRLSDGGLWLLAGWADGSAARVPASDTGVDEGPRTLSGWLERQVLGTAHYRHGGLLNPARGWGHQL